jgi:hypothetical protein
MLDCAEATGDPTAGRRESSIRPIFRAPRRLACYINDCAACLCLAERVQELGLQRQQHASVSVVRRSPLRDRGHAVVGVVVVVDAGALERADRADRLRHGSRRGGHGVKLHA